MSDYEIIQFRNDIIELSVNVSPSDNTVWLTANQLSLLFDRDEKTIRKHINNALKDECDISTVAKFETVQLEGNRLVKRFVEHYNLDMIISIGYRVKSNNGVFFRKWANTILREYLLKGYVINDNRALVTNENYVNLINRVDSIDSRLKFIENNELNYKKEKLIVRSEIFDAVNYLESIITSANNKVLLVDPYVDSKALNILKNTKEKVSVRIITSDKSKLSNIDISNFLSQYSINIGLSIDNDFHDRYLYIDDKIFHLGSSINYLGNKISQIDEILDIDIKEYLMKRVRY